MQLQCKFGVTIRTIERNVQKLQISRCPIPEKIFCQSLSLKCPQNVPGKNCACLRKKVCH